MTDKARSAWEHALRNAPISGWRQELLLLVATNYDSRTRRAAVTQATLASQMQVDDKTAYRRLKMVLETGWLTRTLQGRKGRASEYALTVPQPDSQVPIYDGASAGQSGAHLNGGLSRTPNGSQPDSCTPSAGHLTVPPSSIPQKEPSSPETTVLPYADDDRPRDDDDETFPTIESHLQRAGLDRANWTSWHITRLRHRVWDRLGTGTNYTAIAIALIDKQVLDPLAYIANCDNAGLDDLAHRTANSNSNVNGKKPTRPPWCGQCDERTRLADYDTDTPRQCPICHPKTGALA